jgi:hypothetical protein
MIFKISTISIVLVIFTASCQKSSSSGTSGGGTNSSTNSTACKIDKIQSYGISSATKPDDFYFLYDTDNKLTQINSVSVGAAVLRGMFTYTGSNVTKIEILSLNNSGNLVGGGYFEISYSGNNISNIKYYEKSRSSFVLNATHDYGYNATGQRIQKIIKSINSAGNLALDITYNYSYDNLANIIKIEGRNASNQIDELFNYEYNNKENNLKFYHPQIDAFAWVFFDGFEAFMESGGTDARYLSKHQMVKKILSYPSNGVYTYNFNYTYDSNGKIIQVTSNLDINKSDITYICK